MPSRPRLGPTTGRSAVRSHWLVAVSVPPEALMSNRSTPGRLTALTLLSRSMETYIPALGPVVKVTPSESGSPEPFGYRRALPALQLFAVSGVQIVPFQTSRNRVLGPLRTPQRM